jgi:hypothetical protein
MNRRQSTKQLAVNTAQLQQQHNKHEQEMLALDKKDGQGSLPRRQTTAAVVTTGSSFAMLAALGLPASQQNRDGDAVISPSNTTSTNKPQHPQQHKVFLYQVKGRRRVKVKRVIPTSYKSLNQVAH